MAGELCPIVKGDRPPPLGRESAQDLCHDAGDGAGRLSRRPHSDEEAGVALVQGQDRLAVGLEEHQVGLPVAGGPTVGGVLGTFGQGTAETDEGSRTAASTSAPASFRLATGQLVAPGVVLGPRQLGVDEPVDGLVGDDVFARLQSQAPGNLLWRPALLQAREDPVSQVRIPLQP